MTASGTIQRLGNVPSSSVNVSGAKPAAAAPKQAEEDLEVPAFMRKSLKK